jgi:hypothetical protein
MKRSLDIPGWWVRQEIRRNDRQVLVVQREGPYEAQAKNLESAAVAARIAADRSVRDAKQRRKVAVRKAREIMDAAVKEARRSRKIAAESVKAAKTDLRMARAASIKKPDAKRVREKTIRLERAEANLAAWMAAPSVAAANMEASMAEAEKDEAAVKREASEQVRALKAKAAIAAEKCQKFEGPMATLEAVCPKCGGASVRDGFRSADFCGLPVTDPRYASDDDPPATIPVTVRARRQRYKCRKCRHPFLEAVPDTDEDHSITASALDHMFTMLLGQTSNKKIASQLGIDETTVADIASKRFPDEIKLKRSVPRPIMLGIATIRLEGLPRNVLVDAGNLVVMDVLPDALAGTLSKRLLRLAKRDRISVVAIDLDGRQKDVVRRVFGARSYVIIEGDLFVARAEQALKAFQQAAKADEQLPNIKSRMNAAETAVMQFVQIFDLTDTIRASTALELWLSRLSRQTKSDLQPLVETIYGFKREMILYFGTRLPRIHLGYLRKALRGVERRFKDEPFDFARQRLRHQEGELSAPGGFDCCHSCRNEFPRRDLSATFSVPNELMSRARPYMLRMCEPCRKVSIERLKSWPARWTRVVADLG